MDEEIIVLFGFIEDKEKQAEDFLKSKEGSKEENTNSILGLKTMEQLIKRLPSASTVQELESSIRNELTSETRPFKVSSLQRELAIITEYQEKKGQKNLGISQK